MSPSLMSRTRKRVRAVMDRRHSLFLIGALLCISSFFPSAHGQLRLPRIKEHPASVIVKKHEPAKLECKADGNPPPKIEWYKDNEKVHSTFNRMMLDNSLVFLHVISKKGDGGDTGTYFCVARNEVGKARSHNATLEVALLREEFRHMPENTRAVLGETAAFECSPPKGHPEPSVWWTHNGQRIDLTNGRFTLNGHNLVISDVAQKDHGQYRCIAQNTLGTRESPPAILKVLVRPYFIRAPEVVTAMSGEDIVFHCKVGGDPVPTITWKRENGQILSARSQILEDKALRITHVRPSDEGTYVCEVENSAGQVVSSARLTVNSPPSFVTTPKSVQVTASTVAKMECLVTGNPQPVYFWSKEGTTVLMFPGNTYGKFSVSNDGTLNILNVEKEDRGYYICSAVSHVGSATTRAFLSVTVLSEIPPPIIRLGAANQTLPQATKAFLPCEVAAFPQATIKWFFNQKPLSNDSHYTVTNSLQIQNIQPMDSGIYTCVASSASGLTSWNSRLVVESPHNPNINFHKMPDPSTFPEPPSKPIAVNFTETTITVMWERLGSSGASAHLGCILEYYSPDIKGNGVGGWVEVGRRIQSDIFTVRNLRPNTRYMFVVRAENKHGIGFPSPISDEMQTLDPFSSQTIADVDQNQARVWLNDINIKLRDIRTISSISFKILWHAMGNSDLIDGYYIRYQQMRNELQSNKFNMVTVFGGSSTQYILTDLKKFATYQFFIVPFYKNIEGKPSNMLTGKTFEDIPSAPPLSITVKALNASCALIQWLPPPEDSQNGEIRGYHLQIFENNTLLHANLTLESSYNSIALHNLSFTSFYTIRALAFTSLGNGPLSQPIKFQMESALRNAYEDIHLQPSYQNGFSLQSFWPYVSIAIILTILLVILVKIVFIYTPRKANKSTYEKANNLNENYSDNFAKYDSNSSKYSSFPDNNEYAEVNDLKSYGEAQEKITLVPYAMTPLIENKSNSSNSSRASYNHIQRAAYHPPDHDKLASESLLSTDRKTSYSNGGMMSSINRINYASRFNPVGLFDQDHNLSANIGPLTARGLTQSGMDNDYETATEASPDKHNSSLELDDNLSDYEKSSTSNEYKKNLRNMAPNYPMLMDTNRGFFDFKDKLSTFSSSGSSSPRIILNPCDSVNFESSNHRGSEDFSGEVNHYLVSEELCKLPLNTFGTDHDRRGKLRQELPGVRYNMSLSNDFHYMNNGGGSRRGELSIRDKFIKSKVQNKKRNGKLSSELSDAGHR